MNKVHFALLLELSQKMVSEEATQAAVSQLGEGVTFVLCVWYIGRGDAMKHIREEFGGGNKSSPRKANVERSIRCPLFVLQSLPCKDGTKTVVSACPSGAARLFPGKIISWL